MIDWIITVGFVGLGLAAFLFLGRGGFVTAVAAALGVMAYRKGRAHSDDERKADAIEKIKRADDARASVDPERLRESDGYRRD